MASRENKVDGKLNSILGKDSDFTGDFNVSGGLRIDGKIRGNIKADVLFVGRDAELIGNVEVSRAVIGGKIFGNIVARESLELQSKAELIGDIATKNLIIAEGVVFDGKVDMGMSGKSARNPQSASSKSARNSRSVPNNSARNSRSVSKDRK